MHTSTPQINHPDYGPQRIVCLTEETVETLYLLGEQDRIVGISGFVVRPIAARKEKPVVSAFTDADTDKILALQPDLVIGFSDIQASIAKELISRGVTVWVNNHRTVQGILKMIVQLGALVGKQQEAIRIAGDYAMRLKDIQQLSNQQLHRPKVYFEEWFDPLISGICWVSELVEIAGGDDIYREFQTQSLAKNRIIANPDEVIERNPDIIIASWCGKKFKKEKMLSRKGWNQIAAIKHDFVFEIKSSKILQPGPAALTDGLADIAAIIMRWHGSGQSIGMD